MRLKTRFGAGYKISVSLGDRTDEDTAASKALRELMSRHLGAAPTAETSKAYMHFNVSGAAQVCVSVFCVLCKFCELCVCGCAGVCLYALECVRPRPGVPGGGVRRG